MQPTECTRAWTFVPQEALEAKELAIVFAYSRTMFGKAELRILSPSEQAHPIPIELQKKGRLFKCQIPVPLLEANVPCELRVGYRGDVPQIARVLWVGEKAGRPRGWVPGECALTGEAPDEVRWLVRRELERLTAPARVISPQDFQQVEAQLGDLQDAQILALRRAALEAESRVRLFFLELDEASHPEFGDEALKAPIRQITYKLFQRIELRAHCGSKDLLPQFEAETDPADEKVLRDQLIQISALFVKLVDKHLKPASGGDLIDWAFEQFTSYSAAAYHHDPDRHADIMDCGVPNGSEFFKFAELALICLEKGVDPDLWKRMLPVLVRSSQLFAEQAQPADQGQATMLGANRLEFQQGRFCLIDWRRELQAAYREALDPLSEEDKIRWLTLRFTLMLGQVLKDTNVGAHTFKTTPIPAPAQFALAHRHPPPVAQQNVPPAPGPT